MTSEYREHARVLCKDAVELIEHILIRHDATIIEEMHILVNDIKALKSNLENASAIILQLKAGYTAHIDTDYELISKANKFIEDQSF